MKSLPPNTSPSVRLKAIPQMRATRRDLVCEIGREASKELVASRSRHFLHLGGNCCSERRFARILRPDDTKVNENPKGLDGEAASWCPSAHDSVISVRLAGPFSNSGIRTRVNAPH